MKNSKIEGLKEEQVESLKEGQHKVFVSSPIEKVKELEFLGKFDLSTDFKKDSERYNFFLENRKKRSNSQPSTKLKLISDAELNQVPDDLINEDEISTSQNSISSKFVIHK